MLLKCWGRFQPSSERDRSAGPGPPLDPSLRLPAAPEGTGRGEGGCGETLRTCEYGKGSTGGKASDIGEVGTAGKKVLASAHTQSHKDRCPRHRDTKKKG